ncbi:MAG: hypothetical protein LBU04_06870 [Christensenellaceae bacterium]|jgi:hypothetical protein|nr:hypothetical protein [Christensenellaceae bacterium]
MANKRIIEERVIEQKESTTAGLFFGSLFRLIFASLKIAFMFLFKIIILFGLWLPLVYAGFGLILYVSIGFNPFEGVLYKDVYVTGFSLCMVGAVIISVRNIFIKPFKGLRSNTKVSDKNAVTQNRRQAETLVPVVAPMQNPMNQSREQYMQQYNAFPAQYYHPSVSPYNMPQPYPAPYMPPFQQQAGNFSESPAIYFSKKDRGLLVHEYSDRFELFRIVNGKPVLEKIDHK